MPTSGTRIDRTWIAAVLTAQWLVGLILTLAAFAFLGWLTSMIPSVTNLLIGSLSLTRGVPGVSTLLLRFMPVGVGVAAFVAKSSA